MSTYSCKCPAPGCGYILAADGGNWEEAFKKIFAGGMVHIIEKHPDFPQIEEAGVHRYALENMKI